MNDLLGQTFEYLSSNMNKLQNPDQQNNANIMVKLGYNCGNIIKKSLLPNSDPITFKGEKIETEIMK